MYENMYMNHFKSGQESWWKHFRSRRTKVSVDSHTVSVCTV